MKLEKDVNLFVNVKQNLKEKDADIFEFFTTGKLKKAKEKWIIEYENEYNGISKIELFKNKKVEITATGDVSYFLKLEEKDKTKFSCNTKDTFSYFSVKTQNIFFDITEKEGKIDLKYVLEIDNLGGVLNNQIKIKLKENERGS